MIRNYFFLNRFIVECFPILKDSILKNSFSQERDTLVLEFSGDNRSNFLELNTNPGVPFLTLRKTFHRAKKNTVNFFSDHLNSYLWQISISDSDRIIKLSLDTGEIYFAIRGQFTNVHLIDKLNNIHSFKKTDTNYLDGFQDEISNTNFINKLNFISPDINNTDDFISGAKKKYPIIGKEIVNEFKIRNDGISSGNAILEKVIIDALNSNPVISVNKKNFEIYLLPEKFHIPEAEESKIFDSVADSFNHFLQKTDQLNQYKAKKNKIEKHIDTELKRLSSKLNNLKIRIDKGSKEEKYKLIGNLLLINLTEMRKGNSEITVTNIYEDNADLIVKVDPKLSPKQNVDKYFEKSRSEKINFNKSIELLKQSELKFDKFKNYKLQLENNPNIRELDTIMNKLNIKAQANEKEEQELSEKFKHYIINDTYHVFVGKDSKNNDLLTTRFAKQNDYWFHARSVSGSHVILRIESAKKTIPKDVLKKAASIAAYHSKAKTAGVVPVSYCFKKYVVKKKSMPPGQVNLLKEDTLLVKPEIPEGCIYVQQDL